MFGWPPKKHAVDPAQKPSPEVFIIQLDSELERRMDWISKKKWIPAQRMDSLYFQCEEMFFQASLQYLDDAKNASSQNPTPGERRSDPNG